MKLLTPKLLTIKLPTVLNYHMGQFGSLQLYHLAKNDQQSIITNLTTYHINIPPINCSHLLSANIWNFVTMSDANIFAYECLLCKQYFPSRSKLLTHERNKHRNNKVISHHTSLILLSFELIVYYQDVFIVLIKKWLGFNRHSIGSKWLSIDAFQKLFLFIYLKMNLLFDIVQQNENIIVNFRERLEKKDSSKYLIMKIGTFGKILRQKLWVMFYLLIIREYIQLILAGIYYLGIFLYLIIQWKNKPFSIRSLLELNENARHFQCETATCTFITDSGKFVDE
jgi:hypothetical protein